MLKLSDLASACIHAALSRSCLSSISHWVTAAGYMWCCVHSGINASDINYTAGRYFGSPEIAAKRLPFDAGFESVGAVAATGPDVSGKNTPRAITPVRHTTFWAGPVPILCMWTCTAK